MLAQMAGPNPLVTLSGQTVSDVEFGRVCTAGIRFNSDGTVDELVDSTYTQIDTTTDWIIPNAAASTDFDVRITSVTWNSSSTGFLTEAASEDTWIDLGSNREWSVRDTDSSGSGDKDVQFTVEIRNGAGVTVDTGSYRLIANYSP